MSMQDANGDGSGGRLGITFERAMVVGVTLAVVITVGYIIYMAVKDTEASFGIVAVLILTGLGAFIGIMNFLSMTADWTGIKDKTQPFGLPQGTVRAILTIAFIVLVGVLASYLLTKSSRHQAFAANPILMRQGVTSAEAHQVELQLAPEGLVSIVRSAPNAETYDVQFRARQDYRLSDDVAKQILTMLSTILAAMIGFYFGTRPSGSSATSPQPGATPSVAAPRPALPPLPPAPAVNPDLHPAPAE